MTSSMLRPVTLAGMVALLLGGAPLAQTPEPAQDDSIETVRTRANAGDAAAQFQLGRMYDYGWGVPQDFVEAAAWYRKAAEQGHAEAQNNLGLMCDDGRGVPQDDGEAYLWANLAATYVDASDRDRFAEFRDVVGGHLTPEQRSSIEVRWVPTEPS